LDQINSFEWDIAVSDDKNEAAADARARPGALVALAVVLFFEAAVLGVVSGFLLYELVTEVPASYASAVSILVLALTATVWLIGLGIATIHARPWVRGAAITWQVLQLAVAVGSFQGIFARDDIGWFLLVPAVVALVLLFLPPVVTATRRA
jgi:hypothetical protein